MSGKESFVVETSAMSGPHFLAKAKAQIDDVNETGKDCEFVVTLLNRNGDEYVDVYFTLSSIEFLIAMHRQKYPA